MNLAVPFPDNLGALVALYGPPSQTGFGSAVFYEPAMQADDLEQIALRDYQFFVGDLWERFGETAWLGAWNRVYTRLSGTQPNIVAELRAIAHPAAAQYMPMLLLADSDDSETAQQALAAAYDDSTVIDLSVFTIGDGAALSGLLIAGRLTTNETLVLISLLD